MITEHLLKAFLFSFRIAVILGILVAVFVPAIPAQAASITVDSLLNITNNADGVCTIREAIINANNDAATWTNCPAGTGADVISFSVAGTVTLTSALPNITDVDGLTINGGNNITISGNNLFRIVTVNANVPATFQNITFTAGSVNGSGGAISNAGNLTITSVSFTNNLTITNAANDGGAINNLATGTLTITNSTFTGNYTLDNGGAIYIAGGTVNITGSAFTNNNNAAIDDGGAIYLNAGTLTISNSTFTGNGCNEEGGAIFKNGGTLTIDNNSLFSGNISVNNGGGVYAVNAGTTTITNSTFQNHTDANINSGAGLYFANGTLNVTGSTFSGNRAQSAGDQGGGMYIASGTATITGTTFTSNIADTFGGAVRVAGGTVTISSSTFTGNTATANDGGALYTAVGTVNISNTVFTNNAAGTDGGAVAVASGTATLTGATFNTNRADDGGAVYHNAATLLTISNSAFTGNLANGEADGDGGALTMNNAAAGSSLTITGSTFSNNIANDDGGGLWNNAEPVTITSTIFSGNQARSGNGAAEGGAIYNSANADATSIRLSTFTNNTVAATANVNAYGGAIANYGAGFILANDTFSSNAITKSTAGAGNSRGGALWSNDTSTIHNVTFNGNSAAESGTGTADGGSVYRNAGVVTIANSILANAIENATAGNCGGTITNGGNNIHFNGADCPAAFTNIDPNLAALTGTPAYFPLNAASPAVNAGSNAICATATTTNNTSQNGVVRPVGVNCDIGSYELPDLSPTVLSITRVNLSPTNVASVDFLIMFSEAVTGGDATNFTLTTTGTIAGASVTSVSAGPGATRTVTVNTGSGDGTIRLDMANSIGVADGGANSVTNIPFTTGEVYVIDKTAPDTSITANPANPSNITTAAFTFTGTDGGSGVALFECQLDGGGFGACTSPQNYAGLTDGLHTFDVRAIDVVGNVDASPASFSWTVDTVSPDTSITATPATPSNSSSASFSFTGTDGGSGVASFQCQLDGGGFGACTSPQNYIGLTDGSHTFDVRAIDNAGNVDTTPASYAWTIDTTVPDTTLLTTPPNPDNNVTPAFTFSSPDLTATFECQLDGGGYSPCNSGDTFGSLVDGPHAFDVRAVDALGNTDPTPASYTWTLDLGAPETNIDSAPANPTNLLAAIFTFSSPDVTATFECQLDGGGFTACSTSLNYAVLSAGPHTFEVRAVDSANNFDSTPAAFTWIIDLGFPTVTASTPANNATVTLGPNQITITFSEDVKNDGSAGAANNTANYLLVEDGVNNTFDTVSCVAGLVADDTQITINSATYTNNGGSGPFVATLAVNSSMSLPAGAYRLYVCGTTSIEDLASNELNNGASDALVNFTVVPAQQGGGNSVSASQQTSLIPATGFPQNKISTLPIQPADKLYASTDLWLEIPKLGVKMSVVGVPQTKDGWDVTWLNKEAGWLSGSAFPTWDGNSVLTGHVWDALNKPGPFAQLKSLKYGDQVKIHAFGMVYVYEIRTSQTVNPVNIASVFKHEDKSWITLVTCEDYKEKSKTYSYRRMVRAVLVSVQIEK